MKVNSEYAAAHTSSSPCLFHSDFKILFSNEWLNDCIINSVQRLLKQQFPMCGLQITLCGQNLSFDVVPLNEKYIQILHINGNHWVTVSNMSNY